MWTAYLFSCCNITQRAPAGSIEEGWEEGDAYGEEIGGSGEGGKGALRTLQPLEPRI